MSIEADLFTYITGKANITALIASRFYPNIKPQTAVYPAAVYSFITRDNDNALLSASGLVSGLLQIDAYSYTHAEVIAIKETFRNALDGYRNKDMGSTFINGITLITDDSDFIKPDDESQVNIYRQTLTFNINYQQSLPNDLT